MPRYIDGFLIPVPTANLDTYRKISEECGRIWKEYGALEYIECVGDDLEVKDQRSFEESAGATEAESVVFSYIVYESREHRDAVNAKVMADPRMGQMCKEGPPPFDFKRMAYGGFKAIVEV